MKYLKYNETFEIIIEIFEITNTIRAYLQCTVMGEVVSSDWYILFTSSISSTRGSPELGTPTSGHPRN